MAGKHRRLAHLVAIAALVALLGSGGPAQAQSREPAPPAEPAAGGATQEIQVSGDGGAVDQVRITTDTRDQTLAVGIANFFQVFPIGAALSMPLPPNSSRLIIATFTAESACWYSGSGTGTYRCQVRIVIDGEEGHPASGFGFGFDSTNSGNETSNSDESHTVTRWRRVTNTTNQRRDVPIRVEASTSGIGVSLRLDDWTLLAFRVVPSRLG